MKKRRLFYYSIVAILVAVSVVNLVRNSQDKLELGNFYNAPAIKAKLDVDVELNAVESMNNKACKLITENTLEEYKRYLGSLKKVTIHNDANLRRGLANEELIYVRCMPDLVEFKNVLIHEIGHVVDLGLLTGSKKKVSNFMDFKDPVLADDPSVRYYEISWNDEDSMKINSVDQDFVSGYSSENAFEDFAEAFFMYHEYNQVFADLAKYNPKLKLKYDFFKTELDQKYVADNSPLRLQSEAEVKLGQIRLYDATQFHKYVQFGLN